MTPLLLLSLSAAASSSSASPIDCSEFDADYYLSPWAGAPEVKQLKDGEVGELKASLKADL